MKLSFDLRTDDWVLFQEYFKEKKAPLYKYLTPLLIFSAVMLATMNGLYIYYQSTSYVTLFSLCLLAIVLYLLYLKGRMKGRLKKTAIDIQSKNPEAFGPREMDFNNRCVEITAGNSHKILAWGELSGYNQNKDYFFLYSQKGMVYIIPKRDLEDVPGLEEILNEHLSEI